MSSADSFDPVHLINPSGDPSVLILCDHASNAVPVAYDRLGLPASAFERHIAYDIGAAAVARGLADRLNCPAVLAGFSRLLIDPNRGEDDPTLVMKLSDGAIIPANRRVDGFNDVSEFERRKTLYYLPYHGAVASAIAAARAQHIVPALLSIHSFTPSWKGRDRPWQGGILWDKDDRLARPLMDVLSQQEGLIIGDNQPYSGELKGDTMYRHATLAGLPHALIEIRQDLIAETDGQEIWTDLLAKAITTVLRDDRIRTICHYGSSTDGG